MVEWREVRSALGETRRYLLSHHEPAEYDRCFAPVLFGRRVHLCARCSGVYPGILAGLVAVLLGPAALSGLVLVVVLPLPALLDWAATTFTARRGRNAVRTATGGLLGYGYAVGLGRLFLGGDVRVLLVGLGYGVVAAGLLALDRGRETGDTDEAAVPSVDE